MRSRSVERSACVEHDPSSWPAAHEPFPSADSPTITRAQREAQGEAVPLLQAQHEMPMSQTKQKLLLALVVFQCLTLCLLACGSWAYIYYLRARAPAARFDATSQTSIAAGNSSGGSTSQLRLIPALTPVTPAGTDAALDLASHRAEDEALRTRHEENPRLASKLSARERQEARRERNRLRNMERKMNATMRQQRRAEEREARQVAAKERVQRAEARASSASSNAEAREARRMKRRKAAAKKARGAHREGSAAALRQDVPQAYRLPGKT